MSTTPRPVTTPRPAALTPQEAARDSVRGLALGDGFGERWFFRGNREAVEMIRARTIEAGDTPWHYTDDTVMALAILRVLEDDGLLEGQRLAESFARAYAEDPYRGYGYGMHQLLPLLVEDPGNWATYARTLFDGQGSLGNGGAMRAAPLGAWFHGDLDRVVEQATLSAAVTHAHPEGIAGAVAVAVAAALAAAGRGGLVPDGAVFLRETALLTPAGVVRDGLFAAAEVDGATPAWKASDVLGNGQRIRASDTVPFALWSAAHHLDDLESALWVTAEGLGDVDTTCAITGGVVGARTGGGRVPVGWVERCEGLPGWWVR
jgi:ADP-ribosylglycohydrolase